MVERAHDARVAPLVVRPFSCRGRSPGAGADVTLEVRPREGSAWVAAVVAGGYGVPPAHPRQVVAMPDPDSFLVTVEGCGCVVSAAAPSRSQDVGLFPVTGVRVIEARRLVVVADFTDLIAFGTSGRLWHSGRLAWDDLRMLDSGDDWLLVSGFFAGRDDERFLVDLSTGAVLGSRRLPSRPWRRRRRRPRS